MGVKRGVYKNSKSYYILLALEKAVDGYVRFDDFINNPGFYAYGTDRHLKKSELAWALKQLREQGFIEEDKIDVNKVILKLTSSGKEALGVEHDQREWDGKWRIVMFDIPEQKRIIRNLFRRNLKKWGFKQLQKSVWVSKMDVYDKLVKYIKELEIEKWVTVMEADKSSDLNS